MWKLVENSDENKPEEFEIGADTVYLRKDFEFIESSDSRPAHWSYKEKEFSREAYNAYLEQQELTKLLNET